MLILASLALTPASQAQEPPAANEPAEISVSAQRVYVDPATGRLTDTPPPGVELPTLSRAELRQLSTSHEGLVATPLAAGGHAVDLQGRFRHVAVAVVGADGRIEIREVSGAELLQVLAAADSK